MISQLITKMCAKGWTLWIKKGPAKDSVTITGEYDDTEREASGTKLLNVLYDLLEASGDESLLSEAARDFGKAKNRTEKQTKASSENGKKGGRKEGSKDSYQRVRTRK